MYVNVFVDSDLLIIIVIDLHIRYCSLINFRLFIKHNIYYIEFLNEKRNYINVVFYNHLPSIMKEKNFVYVIED